MSQPHNETAYGADQDGGLSQEPGDARPGVEQDSGGSHPR